ncbi:uncharacterized protein LOC109826581 [Asparagus officinalis]|uniref:uncharacterized protein LOC109826581 n=1 Tax=Asparagus officinalis TaxID=4686 RepID=UPI00098DF159|nr:uncharacterized protein LOC109826581 [Asparagus officinalis]
MNGLYDNPYLYMPLQSFCMTKEQVQDSFGTTLVIPAKAGGEKKVIYGKGRKSLIPDYFLEEDDDDDKPAPHLFRKVDMPIMSSAKRPNTVNDERDSRIQLKRTREEFERREDDDIIMVVVSFIVAAIGAWYYTKHMVKESSRTHEEEDERTYLRKSWIRNLICNANNCVEQLRMNPQAFKRLCDVLCTRGGLVASRNVTIEEIVAMFLHILAHNVKNRTSKTDFYRSNETISRQFHKVLQAVMKIGSLYIKQEYTNPNERDIEKWKWFEDAIGALDGTHIQLTIPLEDQSRYRNRKGENSTNVLGVCDANLRFSYVLPGWEGSTSDSRVLRDALRRPNGLKLPSNKYFLVDAGYTNGPGFLAPYRGTRYHIKSWRENGPRNYKELFNQRHSSARNTIERAVGLLKKRWAILRTASFYSVKIQIRIINACCILHNFLREEMNEDDLLNDVDQELEDSPVLEIENVDDERITTVRVTDEWSNFRDNLTMQMWDEYRLLHLMMTKKGKQIASHSRSYVVWNRDMDVALANVLYDQMNQGLKVDGTWKPQVYQVAVDALK